MIFNWNSPSSNRISYTTGSYTLNFLLFKKLKSSYGGAVFLYNDGGSFTVSKCFFFECNSTSLYSNPKRSQASGGAVYSFGKSIFTDNCFNNCHSFNGFGGGCYYGTNLNNQINQNRNSYYLCSSIHGGSFLSDFGYQQLYNINSSYSTSTSDISGGGSTMYPSSSISQYIQLFKLSGSSSWNIESQSGTTSNFKNSNIINSSTTYLFSIYKSNSIVSSSNFLNVKYNVFRIYSGSASMNNCYSNNVLSNTGYILTSNIIFYNILTPTILCFTPFFSNSYLQKNLIFTFSFYFLLY